MAKIYEYTKRYIVKYDNSIEEADNVCYFGGKAFSIEPPDAYDFAPTLWDVQEVWENTTMCDKQGVPFYEGSIVRCRTLYGLGYGVVEWRGAAWRVNVEIAGKVRMPTTYELQKYMEIVGHVSKPTQLMLWIDQAVHGVMPEKKGAK
ncbi:hypothetical protein HCB26_06205 [Listeria booriae]|uniref:YopX protein domain-containing protein n=1 Tax=Listeria booriae TaxID=1552123 RepID=A0A7X0YYY8_9LIST|nr:hypothetical protein [Listeria booriae]MBC2166158.1 hypothetical protein [Listeria booriae]